ncbi:MAG TPA: DUF4097 family beta strand repeat-containing protein [Candidatus Acidoferrales bacterium]|nr:DUF4097 family beta strand repeat-containing protein [Candidatus Acidoferrales bacterium]
MNNPGPRRGSIFGGLLLIAIGVLFLIHYMVPGLLHLGELARYWPLLLIVWGLARLWDHFAAQRANQQPPRAVSAGELLLILLVIAGVAAVVAFGRLHGGGPMWDTEIGFFGSPYTFTSTLPVQPVTAGSRLDLWTPRGNINVRAQPEPNVNAAVTKIVNAASQAAAQQTADRTTVAFEATAQALRLEPKMPSGGDNEQVNYDVSAFPQISLSASTGRGDVDVDGIAGEVAASAAGGIEVSNSGSDTTLDLRRGNVHVHSAAGNVLINGHGEQVDVGEVAGSASINGEFYGPIRIRAVAKNLQFNSSRTSFSVTALPGRFEMDSGRLVLSDTPGDASLETREKDIEFENVQGRLHVVNHNGGVEIRFSRPPRSDIDVSNGSGDIELVLPPESSFSIAAESRSGDISSDFQTPTLKLVESSPDSRLEGAVGAEGPKISLNTSYGTIRIRKAPATTPAPPTPPVPPTAPTSR